MSHPNPAVSARKGTSASDLTRTGVTSLLNTVIIGAYVAGFGVAALGVVIVYLRARGAITELSILGATFRSTDVGVAAILFGALIIVLNVFGALRSLIVLLGHQRTTIRAGSDLPQPAIDNAAAAVVSLTGLAGAAPISLGTISHQMAIRAQVQISLLTPPERLPEITSQLTQMGFEVPLLTGESPAALLQDARPKPSLGELFEIITDPNEVMRALFRTESSAGLAPYDVEYINDREDISNVQQALETALRDTKGRLLISGLRGLGKTREVAELARAACATKWKILVARTEGDARLGPLSAMPPELTDAKALIVIDNLHTRIRAGSDGPGPRYMERLDLLLKWFERQLPGSVRVIATARDEPFFQQDVDLPRDNTPWHGFGVFRLPRLTDKGLRQMLMSLAARAQVPVAEADLAELIQNSDRKPETVFINVSYARQKRIDLTPTAWLPTEGETWALRFRGARAEYGGVDRVCQLLQLFTEAGVPPRAAYVIAVSHDLGEQRARAAVDALVGEGLLKLRHGILTPFSAEQLKELLGQTDAPVLAFDEHWERVERVITAPDTRPSEWVDDLVSLVLSLDRAGHADRADTVASRAIELKMGGARVYRLRSGIRFTSGKLDQAEADLTKALEIGSDDLDALFMRASIRNLLGSFDEALDDLDRVMRGGRDDAPVHQQRGVAYYHLSRWPDAELELSAAVARGEATGSTFFSRGMVRFQLKDAAGAEQDLSAALEHGIDLVSLADRIHEIEAGVASRSVPVAPAGEAGSDLIAYALRGFLRFTLGSNAAAEEDLTKAIEGGVGGQLKTLADQLGESTLPMLAFARKQFQLGPVPFEALLFYIRGLARLNQERSPEAEADLSEALARGFVDGEVYYGRACARFSLKNLPGAEQDASSALDARKADTFTYSLRGVVRLQLEKFPEAEQDFDQAIALGRNDADVVYWRSGARLNQNKTAEAEQDLTVAIDRGKTDAQVWFARGCARLDLQRYGEAEEDLTRALELGFDQPTLFVIRGAARLQQHNLSEAEQDISTAFKRGVHDVNAYSVRGELLVEQERYEDAEAALTSAIGLGRNDAWVYAIRGSARQALKRYAEAESDYDAVIARGIVDANVFASRARTRLAQSKWPEAEADLMAAIEAGRDDVLVHFNLGLARKEQKNYAAAEPEFDLALARQDQPVVRGARGSIRLLRGNLRGAEQDFTDVIAKDQCDANGRYLRGLIRYAQQRSEDALADYDAALILSPDDMTFLGSRVLVNLRLGKLDEAAKDCANLEAIDRDASDALGPSGALCLAKGDLNGALNRLEAAAKAEPEWNCWLGLAYLMNDRPVEAQESYRLGTADSTPVFILIALGELDWYIGRRERPSNSDSLTAVATIRARLRKQADAQQANSGAPPLV